MKKDGTGKEIIYKADSGSVLSMQAMDGMLYFTAWTADSQEGNVNLNTVCLYGYDLRWNRLKKIIEYKGSEAQYNAGLTIVDSDDHDHVYCVYQSTTAERNEEPDENEPYVESGIYTSELLVYTPKDKSVRSVRNDTLDGYLYLVKDSYNKVLYDYKNDEYWIANTAFGQEGSYIAAIYAVDYERNRIYADEQDYSGLQIGDEIPQGMTRQYAVLDITQFQSKNFAFCDDYGKYKDVLDWIRIYQ